MALHAAFAPRFSLTLRARLLASVVAMGASLGMLKAATAQDVAAEAVFEEGVKLFEAARFEEACPKLKTAVQLASTEPLGGKLLLAECYEKLGRWASAWGLYRELVPKATAAGQPERAQKAEAGRARVEPRLARHRVLVAPEIAASSGFTLERDGEVLPRDAWDVATPVDPGPLALRVSATGKRPREQRLTIRDAAETTTTRIDALEDAAPATAVAVAPADATTAPPPADDVRDEGGLSGLGIAGIVVGASGLVAIGVSAVVAIGAKSSWEDAVAARSDAGVDDARGTGDLGTGVFVVGAVLSTVGGALLVVDLATPSASGASGGLRLRTNGLGASAQGRF